MFSIIMPTYNCEMFICEAISSILNQTFNKFELVIVDDGSTDNTYNKCCELAKIDSRIRLYSSNHLGVSATRNIGIEQARYEFLLFVDGDDTLDKQLLEKASQSLQNIDCLIYGICEDYYLEDGTFIKCQNNDYGTLEIPLNIDKDLEKMFLQYNMVSACNKVYRKSILEKHSIAFSTKCVYEEDLKFNFDYLRFADKLVFLNEDLYHYRRVMKKQQILKREFPDFYTNSDQVYNSCNTFLIDRHNKKCTDSTLFCSMLTSTYLHEAYSHISKGDAKTRIEAIKKLNKNEGFKSLVKSMKGKFITLLHFTMVLNLLQLEAKLIIKRYEHEK